MNLFLYLNKDTYMHRLDPRTKIIVLIASFIIGILFSSPISLTVFSLAVIVYGATGKILGNLKRIWFILLTIGIFTIIMWAFFAQGTTPLLGPVELESLLYGIAMAIKIDIMIIAGMIFLSSTKIEEISLGLMKLGLPYQAAFAFSTAIRLVPTIIANCYTIIEAQKSRGLNADEGNIIQKIKKFVPLLIPVFLSIIRSTNTFGMALESKGFGAQKFRSSIIDSKFSKIDFFIISLSIICIVISVYLRIIGYGVVQGVIL
ncbi:MAG: energy-coupling factor transport system permease protein [Petroclostridium sp.]|uniref:energy-coupling factor transporter transmembrane component T family protein n=1 Tax=Petroclostridium xylanilyticum TaxID=1792311 RepID=UPI000B981E48|nr:energy-coupling factor transporter transmembrane component T [Petroclostridium xylanilyticum]MDK2811033.1 energy-coupling factor transport system permease protein [Petroclostridium sp.]